MPMPASSAPPTVGPSMREALFAPTSIDIAMFIRSPPAACPIITRRIGLSAAQPQPLMKLASATCHTASCPAIALAASAASPSSSRPTTAISAVRRSTRSA